VMRLIQSWTRKDHMNARKDRTNDRVDRSPLSRHGIVGDKDVDLLASDISWYPGHSPGFQRPTFLLGLPVDSSSGLFTPAVSQIARRSWIACRSSYLVGNRAAAAFVCLLVSVLLRSPCGNPEGLLEPP
jgi:hypothetical protein